jgi:hypothetical protein
MKFVDGRYLRRAHASFSGSRHLVRPATDMSVANRTRWRERRGERPEPGCRRDPDPTVPPKLSVLNEMLISCSSE